MRAQLALVLVPWCPLLATRQMSPCRTLEGLNGKMCERLHTSLVVQKMQGDFGIGDYLGPCHVGDGRRPQPSCGRGKLAERIEVEFGPFRPAASRRAECFLVALPTSEDLFICAKDLLFEAKAVQLFITTRAPCRRVMRALGQRRIACLVGYCSPRCSRRRWRGRPMNHPITNTANRNAMITPMLTST